MTDKLREAAQQALDDDLLIGQAQHLISALMNRGFLPNNLPTAEYITLWNVVKRQLRCVNKEGARAALAQQDAQKVPQEYSGVRCMCVLTGCRAGPGCPRYNSHCRAHINHVNAAPTPPAQLPEARQWTGLTDIGVYFAITAAGKPPNPMSEEFFAWCEKFADAIEANLKERNT